MSEATYRLPGPLVPLRAVHVSVALLLRGSLRAHFLQALRIIHHGGYPTRDDLLALDLPTLLALLTALLGAGGPWTFHPHRWTGLPATTLRISWFQLNIAQAVIHWLAVAPSYAGHPSRLVAFGDK